ncbi:hypothetical protein NTHI1209_00786 [Haemophilus influenzae]|uniref:Uncharacterized protein n=1 Tax=Haemophilus influenzae TaxID=727 RepID=A0A158SWD9_HAEIF|nr:hypothetical protein NTHI1209_00786 [Haemophilus influenzae]
MGQNNPQKQDGILSRLFSVRETQEKLTALLS